MTDEMNTNRSASEVYKRPVNTDNGVYLWLIIGCSLGGALLLTLVIAGLVYLRRSKRKSSRQLISHPGYIPGSEFCPQQMMSSFSSSASDDTSEAGGARQFRRPLGPSTSLDPPSLLRLTSECVQPKPTLTRWHTVASPQTTPILLDADRDSDEEACHSAPCLHGRLWFSVDYKPDLNQLEVTLHKAKYLPGRGLVNSPRDPFVKVFLLPDEETFHQSKIRKRTLSPKFHEIFTFDVKPVDLRKRTLKMSVYDVDKRKVRHCLGHVLQPLEQYEELVGKGTLRRDLEIAPQSSASPGEIQLCLSCNPFSNRIKVTVCRVRYLQQLPEQEVALFVRVELYHGRRLVKCKRTQSVGGCRAGELIFDESFSFGVSGRFFDSCSLGFVLLTESDSTSLGKVVIGPFMYARGDQLQHWQEMLSNPRNTVTRWHPLETSSSKKS